MSLGLNLSLFSSFTLSKIHTNKENTELGMPIINKTTHESIELAYYSLNYIHKYIGAFFYTSKKP